jgi:hypothetical protein
VSRPSAPAAEGFALVIPCTTRVRVRSGRAVAKFAETAPLHAGRRGRCDTVDERKRTGAGVPGLRGRAGGAAAAQDDVRGAGACLPRSTLSPSSWAHVSCAHFAPPRGRAHEASSAGGRRAVPGRGYANPRQRGSASPPGASPGPRVWLKASIRPKTLRGAVNGAA